MPVDWETVRANRQQAAAMSDWDKRAAEQVKRDRETYVKEREAEQHRRELASFAEFANARAAECAKRNDPDEATWLIAASHAKAGNFTHSRVISAHPAITQFQGLRARLAYEGKVVIHDAEL